MNEPKIASLRANTYAEDRARNRAEVLARRAERKRLAVPRVIVPVPVPVPIKKVRLPKPPKVVSPKAVAIEKTKTSRIVVRRQLLEMFGAQCSRCDYGEFESALEFHHKDPNDKAYEIGKLIARYCASGFTADWELLLTEVKKCKILCSNCHQAFHHGAWRELPGY